MRFASAKSNFCCFHWRCSGPPLQIPKYRAPFLYTYICEQLIFNTWKYSSNMRYAILCYNIHSTSCAIYTNACKSRSNAQQKAIKKCSSFSAQWIPVNGQFYVLICDIWPLALTFKWSVLLVTYATNELHLNNSFFFLLLLLIISLSIENEIQLKRILSSVINLNFSWLSRR